MTQGLRWFPEQASTVASQVDALFLFLVAVSVFFAGLIFLLVAVFALKYRRKSEEERPRAIHGSLALEALWTVIPLGIALVIFVWGAYLYFVITHPPAASMEVYVVGKQWMWKLQHPTGPREINELHVPVNRPVKLTMTSEDVIHSFYVPAFRIKADVVPGKYTTAWFEATKTGEYHLFCAEYCGTSHAVMGGRIVVMEPADYERWLTGGVAGESLPAAGERLFARLGCTTCHRADGSGRGPSLVGRFGKSEKLASGETVLIDEGYVRESILNPQAKLVAGYPPIMPTFKGLVTEDGLLQLIAYIKSMKIADGTQAKP
ncbi:MAG: cytochrome c oxidase subunit II [candidate division NC10 bacterium RBG_16_65_8]|nr:MAG: cytochrome c oxidase subunit II [candidate division NC10 bacterium RBG_16_65_8]